MKLRFAGAVAPASFASLREAPWRRRRWRHHDVPAEGRQRPGLIPPVNAEGNFNTAAEPNQAGLLTPVVYHGGKTMTGGVTVHAIFWTPAGTGTSFPIAGGVVTIGNEDLISQFFNDVSTASTGASGQSCTTTACNMFTVEPQYGWGLTHGGTTSGDNAISFNDTQTTYPTGFTAADDVINDTDSSPRSRGGATSCSSPLSAKYCILDSQVQQEVANIVSAAGGSSAAGLRNLWYVFLPPDVDECISYDVCGTNAFGGYHSLSDVNSTNGVTIYAVTIDPTIEARVDQGADPEGNPDAEVAVDIAGHETNEAMTDPEGTGWMNPNGWEVADMCEFGPQDGAPLGFAADGSPYNQVISNHKYLIQEMWSNAGGDGDSAPSCVRSTTDTANDLPLPQVNLTQFGSSVSGNTEVPSAGGGTVTVALDRSADALGNPVEVAHVSGPIAADGSWSVSVAPYAVGDDRDEIDVSYSGNGAPTDSQENPAVILTGNGGDPFTQSGWTGWTALDNGNFLTDSNPFPATDFANSGDPALLNGPCFQTGVLNYAIGGVPSNSPPQGTLTDTCGTASDIADVTLSSPPTLGQAFTVTSFDNRAFQPLDTASPDQDGTLVGMTVPVGEPDSASAFPAPQFPTTGFPTCAADLAAQTATCSGLVPGASYTVNGVGANAVDDGNPGDGIDGTVTVSILVHRSGTVTLQNAAGRTLTTLHVANLQVALNDASPGAVTSGIARRVSTGAAR